MASGHEYEVTLSIYSGRPDPSWKIHRSHEGLKKIEEHHKKAKSSNMSYHRQRIHSKLGFRGFLVHHKDAEHPELIVGPETAEFQKLLLHTMPKELKSDVLHKKILQMISITPAPSEAAEEPAPTPAAPSGPSRSSPDAPVLDLAKWNDDPDITENNNCYNYGNNHITNTVAQPGNATGHPLHWPIAVPEVITSAESDGLKKLEPQPGPDDPSPSTGQSPPGDWIVALVVAPGVDYHWYRLDSNELWSHKPGRTKATRFDGDGHLIGDPRKAANGNTPYEFVCFMTTNKNVKIN